MRKINMKKQSTTPSRIVKGFVFFRRTAPMGRAMGAGIELCYRLRKSIDDKDHEG